MQNEALKYRAVQPTFHFWVWPVVLLLLGVITILSGIQMFFALIIGAILIIGALLLLVGGRAVFFEIEGETIQVRQHQVPWQTIIKATSFSSGEGIRPNTIVFHLNHEVDEPKAFFPRFKEKYLNKAHVFGRKQVTVDFSSASEYNRHLPVLKNWLKEKFEG